MSEANDKSIYKAIDPKYLEPYLKLPSGLPLGQIKKQAKKIKAAQNVSQTEALKIMLWGNGLPQVRDYAQAIPILIEENFGIKADEMAFIYEDDLLTGIVHKNPLDEEGRFRSIKSSPTLFGKQEDEEVDKKLFVKQAAEYLRLIADSNNKKARFVETIRTILSKAGDDYVTYRNGTSLLTFEDKHDVDFDIEKMLISTGQSGGTLGLRYALASTYNNSATENVLSKHNLMRNLEDFEEDYGFLPQAKSQFEEYLAPVNARCFNFGYLCYNLDKEATQLIHDLIDNYQGW